MKALQARDIFLSYAANGAGTNASVSVFKHLEHSKYTFKK